VRENNQIKSNQIMLYYLKIENLNMWSVGGESEGRGCDVEKDSY
jgi:hypothetical protein